MNILSNKITKANKKHKCNLCWSDINKGELYLRQVNTDNGIQTFKGCEVCMYILETYYKPSEWEEIFELEHSTDDVIKSKGFFISELKLKEGIQ